MSEGNKHDQVSIFDCVEIKAIRRWWLKKIQDWQTYAEKDYFYVLVDLFTNLIDIFISIKN
jgi:hypothetical protein